MSWKKETAIEGGVSSGCLCCGVKATVAPMETVMAVGFGDVSVTKDGKTEWSGDDLEKTLQEFEDIAAKDPDHDWRFKKNAPLYDAVWQRHTEKTWVLIEKGPGFA
jgi:hypothetical protein